jgi:ATP-dependent Clp protease ATP-binding subunit ClpC
VFERFTEQARQAVVFAHEEARELRHRDIGVEHLLLGVARVAPPLLGERPTELREAIRRQRPPEVEQPSEWLRFSRKAHGSLQLAEEEVVYQGHKHGGPAHLVLGMLNAAADAVRPLVAEVEQLRARALEMAGLPQIVRPEDVEGALRAGHAVQVILGEGLPIGDVGNRRADARVLLAMLAANGQLGRLLREHGLEESVVRPLLEP